jgi:sulfate adenylyltransferase subunit 2
MAKIQPKKQAIELKIAGKSLSEIAKVTGLSRPTIIKAYREYLDPPPQKVAGRPSLKQQIINNNLIKQLLKCKEVLTFTNLLNQMNTHQSITISEKSLWELFKKLGWIPTREHLKLLKNLNQNFYVSCYHDANRQLFILSGLGHQKKLWVSFHDTPPTESDYLAILELIRLDHSNVAHIQTDISNIKYCPQIQQWQTQHKNIEVSCQTLEVAVASPIISQKPNSTDPTMNNTSSSNSLTHLQRLEAESIHIMREVMAEANNPVMLYSIGKDSAVMLHLARKAFYPAKLPFPLLHIDTHWKFQDMYRFREKMVKDFDLNLIIHTNPDGITQGINPFTHGSQIHTDIMKTQALKQALDQHQFDVAFGGARRDEEKSRAKERIFSFRNTQHHWDPKNQRPELWNLYNTKKNIGESIRVFPLSNWTELDIWQYIYLENIPIVPLYFSQKRPVVLRDNTWIMVDDDRMPLHPGEIPQMKEVRFRTLGCYPLTGAIESQAKTLLDIIQEMLLAKTSERQGRVIDHDSSASMEKKKQEGYF